MKINFFGFLIIILLLTGCSNAFEEYSYEEALKNRLDEIIIEYDSDDMGYEEVLKEEQYRYFDINKIFKWGSEHVIDQYTALEIGDAVIKSNFDEKQIEQMKNYDVYELDGKDIFIVKRYDDQKNIYVALDKTNCEILSVWEE